MSTLSETKRGNLALFGLIAAVLLPPAGIVICHIALSQSRQPASGSSRGMAIAGLIVGYVLTVAYVFFLVAATMMVAALEA